MPLPILILGYICAFSWFNMGYSHSIKSKVISLLDKDSKGYDWPTSLFLATFSVFSG